MDSRRRVVSLSLRPPGVTSAALWASRPTSARAVSELRAATDYAQYAGVYGITDISLGGSDVTQSGSQLRDPDRGEFAPKFHGVGVIRIQISDRLRFCADGNILTSTDG